MKFRRVTVMNGGCGSSVCVHLKSIFEEDIIDGGGLKQKSIGVGSV